TSPKATALHRHGLPCAPPSAPARRSSDLTSPGSGMSPVAVSASVGSLTANTTYDFRIVATNAGGESKGENESFKTLEEAHLAPPAEAHPANPLTPTNTARHPMVNPNSTDC